MFLFRLLHKFFPIFSLNQKFQVVVAFRKVEGLNYVFKENEKPSDVLKKDEYKNFFYNNLADKEIAQSEFISEYLPKQLSQKEIEDIVLTTIKQTNSSGMKDMGKVMGMATKELSGKADGKTISQIVIKNLKN